MAEHASTIAALMLLLGATTAAAELPHPSTPAGAFETMSPANQNVARALHEAQLPVQTGEAARKPLSLEQIAELKQKSNGWAQVLKDMQKKGLLLRDRTLAQIVSRYNHTAAPMATSANRATPKTNGEPVARGWRDDEAIAVPAALAVTTTLESTGREMAPTR